MKNNQSVTDSDKTYPTGSEAQPDIKSDIPENEGLHSVCGCGRKPPHSPTDSYMHPAPQPAEQGFERELRTILTRNAGRIPERLEHDIAAILAAHRAARVAEFIRGRNAEVEIIGFTEGCKCLTCKEIAMKLANPLQQLNGDNEHE